VPELKGCKLKDAVSVNELITMSKQKFSGGYFFKGESHPFYKAVCVLKGRVGITAGKRVYVLTSGQMMLHRPGEYHAIWEEGSSKPESVIFSFAAAPFPNIKGYVYELSSELMKEISGIYDEANRIFDIHGYSADASGGLSGVSGKAELSDGIFVGAVKEGMDISACRFAKRLELFLLNALESLSEEAPKYSGKGSENYTRILSVMEENIEKNLTASSLARLCGISVPTLEKTVFRYLHSGAMAYYNVLRMEKAFSMLSSEKSVKETAFTLGYANQNYFSACFKKHYGFPPSDVKKRVV